MRPGLAYTDVRGRIFFDPAREPLADGGIVRPVVRSELIAAPRGTIPTMLPGRSPLVRGGRASRRTALAALLPAGYTRLLLPAYEEPMISHRRRGADRFAEVVARQ